jgi:hypothetical protein
MNEEDATDTMLKESNGMAQSVEQMLARLIAGDEKLRELLVKTTQCYIREQMMKREDGGHSEMEGERAGSAIVEEEGQGHRIPYGNWLDEATTGSQP